jgi:hypothetical protein
MAGNLKCIIFCICLSIYYVNTASGQDVNKYDFDRIEDNSFLMEEAYNQEEGVIQHISSFLYVKPKTWIYSFTDEWPVPGIKNQLSVTLPVLSNGNAGLGDVALNYRYQAILRTRLAFSPRLSILFPSGDYRSGLGSGALGYQLNLPVSLLLSRKVVSHYNLGITYLPISKNTDGSKTEIINYNYGVSIILLISAHLNFMFETVGYTTIKKVTNSDKQISNSLLINPGFRYAINCKSGLQIVPGIATPIGFILSNKEFDIFAYLSFEHPLWKPKQINKQ